MSQEKTLDNTESIKNDIKDLEKAQDKKLVDNTSTSTSTTKKSPSRKKSSSNKSKSKKDNSYTDSSDKALGVEAQKPIDAGNPMVTSLQNIQTALTDPELRKEFLGNIADLLGQYQRRKLTDEELQTLEDMIEDGLITKVFKVKKSL